jgi:hypothetical protein
MQMDNRKGVAMNYLRKIVPLALLLSSNLAIADSMSDLCKKLYDPSITGYTRKALELRCIPENSVAKTAYIKDGKGYVVSNGKILETVDGVGNDWTISYADGKVYFNQPLNPSSPQDSTNTAR